MDALHAELEQKLEAWARSQGVKGPSALTLLAPPAHLRCDLALNWPMQAAKGSGRPPLALAQELVPVLGALKDVARAEPSAPGFVNLTLNPAALHRNLGYILGRADRYGTLPAKPSERWHLEFVSANPTGPLHLASGRAATMGDSLARVLRQLGYEVATEYYVNDAGKQVGLLGLSLRARWLESRGEAAALPEGGYQGEYVKDLAKEIEDAEDWTDANFSNFAVERLLREHQRDMEAFGVRFDRWFRESELHKSGALEKTLELLKSKGSAYEKDGATWFGSSSEGDDDKDRVLVKSDGTPTYFLPDIAYHRTKLERGYDRIVDIWGADHHGYVPRMRAALAALGLPPEGFRPIVHQLVHLYRGKQAVKMSKRAGEFVTLREVVDEVGRDACRFFFAMRTPNSHLDFDLELAKKKSQENPVYYVQYVHARISSIFREAVKQGIASDKGMLPSSEAALAPLVADEERALLVKLAWFPEALRTCRRELSPHPLTTYLLELSGMFHPFYEKCRVVDSSNAGLSLARLSLIEGVRLVIAKGLDLLGVSAPDSM